MPIQGNARPQFTDSNGDPIQGGFLYIGMPNQDPKANPLVPAITDLDGNIISNPVQLNDIGTTITPVKVDGDFSQAVFTSADVEVTEYQIARTGGFLTSADLVSVSGQGGAWSSSITYEEDNLVTGTNGKYYISLTASNLGNDPVSSPSSWSQRAGTTIYNVNESYDELDSCILNSVTYQSLVNGNVGNNPETDDGTNWGKFNSRYIDLKSGRRNWIRNGLLSDPINQRVAASLTAATGYTYDLWYYDGVHAYTFVEESDIRETLVVLNWLSDTTAEYQLVANATGSGSLPAGGWTSITKAAPFSLSGISGNRLWVKFTVGGDGFAALDEVQLEEGSVATEFEHMFKDERLPLCKPYYRKSYNDGVSAGTNTTVGLVSMSSRAGDTDTLIVETVQFGQSMADIPEVDIYAQNGDADRFHYTLSGSIVGYIENPQTAFSSTESTAIGGDASSTTLTTGAQYVMRFHYIAKVER